MEQLYQYTLPTRLKIGDEIIIAGRLYDSRRLKISLIKGECAPDYGNVACKLEITSPNEPLKLTTIVDGEEERIEGGYEFSSAGDFFSDQFNLILRTTYEGYGCDLVVRVDQSDLAVYTIKHELSSIGYLEVSGAVMMERLIFQFG